MSHKVLTCAAAILVIAAAGVAVAMAQSGGEERRAGGAAAAGPRPAATPATETAKLETLARVNATCGQVRLDVPGRGGRAVQARMVGLRAALDDAAVRGKVPGAEALAVEQSRYLELLTAKGKVDPKARRSAKERVRAAAEASGLPECGPG